MTAYETSEHIHDLLMRNKQPFVFVCDKKVITNTTSQGIGMLVAHAVICFDVDQYDMQAGFGRWANKLKNLGGNDGNE